MRLGKTVTELRSTMPMVEFQAWMQFHSRFPIDDYSLHHRPAALIAQHVAGGKMEDKLEWLQPSPPADTYGFTEADINTFRAFGLPLPGEE